MERSKNDLSVRKLGLVGLMLLGGVAIGTAQDYDESDNKGVWEFGGDYGWGLRKDYRGIPRDLDDPNVNGKLYATFLIDIPGTHNKVRGGLGVNLGGYNNPKDLYFWGMHVEAQYRPFSSLKGLQFTGRVTIPGDLTRERTTSGDGIAYRHYLTVDVATGWDLRCLVGRFGLHPAVGISWIGFNYRYSENYVPYTVTFSNTSHQIGAFFRLGITYTRKR